MQAIKSFTGKNRFLSNFAEVPITYMGLTYPHAEAAFQAQKCADDEARFKYTNPTLKPGKAKQMGKVEPCLPENWNILSEAIMADIISVKFTNPELRQKLLDTGDAELIEGNKWHDNKWGYCTCPGCANREHKNLLGKLLMEVRNELKENTK